MDPKNTTLIVLPGWGGTRASWQRFADGASEAFFRVCILELPCFGGEPCPSSVWGVADYAAFVRKKIEEIAGPKVLLAHSFGGQVAIHLLAEQQHAVDGVILSGAAIIRPRHVLRRSLFWLPAKIVRFLFKKSSPALFQKIAGSTDYAQTQGISRDIFKKVIREDVFSLLDRVQIPVHVIWGANDRHTPLTHGKRIAAALGTPIEIIPNMTHGIHLHAPEQLLAAAERFTQQL